MDITEDTVMGVAGRLSGGAWPGGTDSVILQNWLLNFGAASGELQLAVADFAKWLGNARPPWSAYRVLTSRRRIALDKHPGVRLVGVVAPHGKVRPEGDGSGGQVRLWNGSVGRSWCACHYQPTNARFTRFGPRPSLRCLSSQPANIQ